MFTLTSLIFFFISSLYLILTKIMRESPNRIFGVYPRREYNYWFKAVFMYIILSIKRIKHKLFPQSVQEIIKQEQIQILSSHPKAVDAVFFQGANKSGDWIAMATARRHNRLIDGFIILKLNEFSSDLLVTPKMPDTSLFNSSEDEHSFNAEGIEIKCIEPMRRWKLIYNGELKHANDNSKKYQVKLEAYWTSNEPYYNFDTDMDPWEMAQTMAYEKWSSNYFELFKEFHQTHYEQFGELDIKLTVDNKEIHTKIDSMRDHSYGKQRHWSNFWRYAFHYGTTENGDHFLVANVCMPIILSRLKLGYLYNAKDKKIYSVRDSSFQLFSIGEGGCQPKDYAICFKAGNKNYELAVNIKESTIFFTSKDWDSKLYESLTMYRLNGVKAWGVSEWCYRNVAGRNIRQSTQ